MMAGELNHNNAVTYGVFKTIITVLSTLIGAIIIIFMMLLGRVQSQVDSETEKTRQNTMEIVRLQTKIDILVVDVRDIKSGTGLLVNKIIGKIE